MKYLIKSLPLLAVSLLLVSCDGDFFESTVEVDIPPHESSLAVSAIFTLTNQKHEVFVSNSLSILSKEQQEAVSGATIRIESSSVEQVFEYDSIGRIYTLENSSLIFQPGEMYTIEVDHPDFPTTTASERMPQAPSILSFTHEREGTIDEDGFEVDEFTVEIEDISLENNYYVFEIAERTVIINGTDTTYVYDPVSSLLSRDPLVRKGFADNYYEGLPMLSDATFNGQTYLLRLYTYDQPTIGNQLVMRVYSVNKARYDYLASLQSYIQNRDNPFSEPVNVISNLEGGVGIFALQNPDERVIVVE
jgi:hypothetical protein